MLAEGDVLNHRYQILRVLSNRGGMGVIYQATDLSFDDTVVIKHSRFTEQFLKQQYPAMPPDQLRSQAEYLHKAFEREARLVRGLKHHALPSVIDYFTNEGHQFFVMDFIPGKDFGELLEERLQQNRGPFPLDQALDWADQLLDALDYLHTRFESPIIHRDLKPLNLKLTPDGRIVLLDFGLAKGTTPGMSVVSASIHGYTLQYAPLEQIRGKGTSVRSDLYSLALTLHHLLTGAMPPSAVDRVTEMTSGEPDPLRPLHEIDPQVPAATSAVFQRAAALNPNERYATAAEMRAALRRVRESEPARATVKLPGQSAAPTVIDLPPPPTEHVQPVSNVQRAGVVTVKDPQAAETREASLPQMDLSVAPTNPPRGSRWKVAALAGGALILATGLGIAVNSGYLFSSAPSKGTGLVPEPTPTVVATTKTPAPNVKPASALQSYVEELGNGVKLEMIALRGGTFEMGSADGQGNDDEHPKHSVTVSPFAIGKYEITQAQWKAVMGADNNPSKFKGDDLPVEMVFFEDVEKFCRILSGKTGRKYRLPTEAEWEYAARAGSKEKYSFGDDKNQLDEYAWFDGNAGNTTHPVGQKKPNEWGLYDMQGNVLEWVQDWYGKDYYQESLNSTDPRGPSSSDRRELRGGSWFNSLNYCRLSNRVWVPRGGRDYKSGFRLVEGTKTP